MKQHGINGVYYGGSWLEIEQCDKSFNIQNGSGACGEDCSVCPRSRSRHSAANNDGIYDVIVVGAGCIGGAVARELSKYALLLGFVIMDFFLFFVLFIKIHKRFNLHVLVLESADDVTQGATKGNSGIVHAGFDDTPGSVRAKFCWKGGKKKVYFFLLVVQKLD
jgi:glycerol-3-phosphate dehydrogenase